jgi:ComF family protein
VGPPGSLAFWARGIAESLFATLFPSDCRLCNNPLLSITRLPVCQSCLSGILPIADGVCSVCGERLWSPYALEDISGDALCGLCRKALPPFAKAAAYGSYDGALRGLLHLLKYEQVRPAARVLGRMLANAIADLEIQPPKGGIPVVPVPLHPRKLRQRGFNQSEVIARAALERVATQMSLNPKVLKRLRETRSQTGLTRHQRRENMRGAFAVVQPQAIEGREILLVDDVFTTGTTVSECARVLHRAGASKVWVATVARTLKAGPQKIELPEESGIEAQTLAG